MPLDANIYQNVDTQAPMRLAAILDPAAQEQRRLQSAQRQAEMQGMERKSRLQQLLGQGGDPEQLAQTLMQSGYLDEATKVRSMADSASMRRDQELERRNKLIREAHGQVGAMGGSDEAIRQVYGALPFIGEEGLSKIMQHAATIPPEGRQGYFLSLSNPELYSKQQEAAQARTEKATEAETARKEKAAQEEIMARLVAGLKPASNEPAPVPVTIEDPKNPGKYLLIDARTNRVIGGAKPTGAAATSPTSPAARTQDANDVLALLDMAEPLIDKATGSYAGAGIDMLARTVGRATEGGNAAAQLKALEGSLISKMPKMSGPQSDKDVMLYKQMAGQIGDPTIPAAQKRAAMKTIRDINSRYATTQTASPVQASPSAAPQVEEWVRGPDGKLRRK